MSTKKIDDKEYNRQLRIIQNENQQILYRQRLEAEKNKYKKKVKLPSTSKIVLWAVILLNVQIILFVESAMMKWGDFSAAYALIGIPATLIPTVWAYYSKSRAENTSGGIVYETALRNQNVEESTDDDAVG